MATNVFDQFDQQAANPFDQFDAPVATKPEKTGMLRAAADIPVQVGRGVAVGVKAFSDAFGSDNPVSRAASGVEGYLGELLSAQAQNNQAEISRIMKEAENKGVGAQVAAAAKAIATAPVDTISQVFGTAIPVIAGGLVGSLTRLGASAVGYGIGATMGAGTVKGSIYEAVKQELKANNVPEAEAERRAQEAQAYGGENIEQILLGAGLGAAASRGAERIITDLIKKGAMKPSALPAAARIPTAAVTEALPEAAQAAQERIAQNIALQREGYDVPTMRGVAGQAAFEGLAGAGLGAIAGAAQRTAPEAKVTKEAETPEGKVAGRTTVVTDEETAARLREEAAEPEMAEAEAPKPVTGEAGIVRPEEETPISREVTKAAEPEVAPPVAPETAAPELAPPMPSAERATLEAVKPDALWNQFNDNPDQGRFLPFKKLTKGRQREWDAAVAAGTADMDTYLQIAGAQLGAEQAREKAKLDKILEASAATSRKRLVEAGVIEPSVTEVSPEPGIAEDRQRAEPVAPQKAEAEAPKPVTGEAGIVRPEEEVAAPKSVATEADKPEVEAGLVATQPPTVETPTAEPTTLTIQRGGSDTTLNLGKPVWQATDDDLVKAVQDSGTYLGKPGSKYDPYMAWREAHSEAIQKAKREGKTFPPEVLYDKPTLIRDDLSDSQADEATDAMVDVYRTTKDYGKAVEAYRNFGKKLAAEAPVAPKPSVAEGEGRAAVSDEEAGVAAQPLTPVLSDYQRQLKEYWDNTATPAIRNYLNAINSFGIDRLEKNKIKPVGVSAREWLESFVRKQSTWDKGRKTGQTGIQTLSIKDLWPTTDGSGERLRKAMLSAVKALKNAPSTSSDLLDQAFREERKSLRATPAQQVSDFEQTLRTALNKFGLKDVGVKLIDGMTEEGSYAQQIIRIAADSANPIRTLRHEAIHALRELGFFTPQQWQSLSKMAKDKWIDQYLKQRNVDGKPLKAGEESRYDAYMREYEGDMEKITEEAVADAFADFDATKPPAGLMQALLTRLRNLFQAIKSALTKVESPEQIFGKVERGELAAAEGVQPTEEARKSLRKEEPRPAPTTAGQSALDTINQLGMGVQPPEPGNIEKIKNTLKNIGENPSLTIQEAKKKFGEWMDWFETKTFSADAKFEADVRRGLKEDMAGMEALIGTMLSVSQSGAVHADAVATQAVLNGRAEYDPETQKWVAVEDKNNITELSRQIEAIADKYGLTKEEAQRVAHTYFVAKNYNGILERNKKTQAQIDSLKKEGKKEEADDLKDTLIFVSPDQEALVEPGLELINQIPELGKMVETWTNIRQNFVKTLVDSYLWSPEYATAMLDNIDYVPFYREEQVQEEEGPQQMIRGLQVKSKEHKLKGSASPVNDVFDNMARWMQYAMNRAIRNHKALQMVDVATEMKVGDRMMAKKVSEPKRGMNVARVWRGGKQEFYDMADPLYVGAFQSLGAVSIPSIKFFTDISNILRKTVVMYPLFSIGQLTQDSVAAIFASGLKPQYAFKIPFLAVQEFIKTMKGWSTTHDELVKYGVVGVRDFNATVARQDAEITAGIKAPRGAWGKINYMLERIAMSADNAVRQATYIAATDAGLSKAESLEKAFEIINFRRRGSSKLLNLMGQTVPFFYAYLSAQRVAYKTLTGVGISPTERKAALETLAQTTAAVMALSFLYAMANGDDEEYKKTPATVRDRSLIIPGSGGVRIPLRPDFFLFPKVIAEHTYQLITDEGYSDGAKFRKSMGDLFANAALSPNPVPQLIKPTLEAGINYSFFEGKPIVGFFEQNKEAGRQFNESTSEFAKMLGQFGASPQMVDHLVRGYFGSVGGLALWGTNFFIEGEPGVPRPELTAHDMLTTMPGVGAFKQKPTENALKVDFYELRDAIAKAKNTYDDMKVRSPEGLEAFLQDEKNLARLAMDKQVTKVGDHLSKIRRAIQQVAAAPAERMSASEKQERIKELRDVEMELLKAVDVKAMRAQAKL